MKWMKPAAALGAAVLLTLSLAACSGGNADETVAAALEKVKGASSVDAEIEMAAEYTTDDQNLSVTNRMTLTTFQDPLKIKAEVSLDMATGGDTYNQTITMYARKEGEDLVQYATDGSYWAKQTTTQDVLDTYNAGDTLAGYVAGASGFRKDGTETVNGAEAVKYTGSVSGQPLVDILETNGYLSSISSMSEDQQSKIKANLVNMPAATITVWVDQAGYLVQMEMDMMEVVNNMEANIDETLGHPSTTTTDDETTNQLVSSVIRLTCSNFDAATDFEIPDEALEAEDLTTSQDTDGTQSTDGTQDTDDSQSTDGSGSTEGTQDAAAGGASAKE